MLDVLVAAPGTAPSPLTDAAAAAATATVAAADVHALSQTLLAAAQGDAAAALSRLQSQADGLDTAEAVRRLRATAPTRLHSSRHCPAGCICGTAI